MSGTDAGTIDVLIVDDHEMVALGLRALLEDEPDVTVVGSAGSIGDALRAVKAHQPTVVLMDYRLPDGTGADAAAQIRALDSPPGVVMVTAVVDRRVLGQALDAGCCGFVSKNANRDELIGAVRAGAANDAYFTPDMLKHLIHLRRFDQVDVSHLSQREIDVLQATADGSTPDEIAAQLYLSAHTVRNHLRNAMSKLGAHTKLEAVVAALRAQLISIGD